MNFLQKLRSENISDEDIIRAFQNICGGYSYSSDALFTFNKNGILFSNVNVSKKGTISKIEVGQYLSSPKTQNEFIQNLLFDLKECHGYKIANRVLMSYKPLNGQFKYKDYFRIRPLENLTMIGKDLALGVEYSNLTKDNYYLGPPFPLILEVRVPKSPNNFVELDRTFKLLDTYQWLISLLFTGVYSYPNLSSSVPKWVVIKQDNLVKYHLAYESFGLHVDDNETKDNFSERSFPEIQKWEGEVDYYNHLWVHDKTLLAPNYLEALLNNFESLNDKQKSRFNRALYWYNVGQRLFKSEHGISVIAFTAAIECLLEPSNLEKCEACGGTKANGPTAQFNKFMATHLDIPDNISKFRDKIYDIRSDLVHGNNVNYVDTGFSSILNHQHQEMITQTFVQRALIGWLRTGELNVSKNQSDNPNN